MALSLAIAETHVGVRENRSSCQDREQAVDLAAPLPRIISCVQG